MFKNAKYVIAALIIHFFYAGVCQAGETQKGKVLLLTTVSVTQMDALVNHFNAGIFGAQKPWEAAMNTVISVFTPTPGLSLSIPVKFNGASLLQTIQF